MAKRTPGQEIAETGKFIFRLFTDPTALDGHDDDVIFSSAECSTCNGEPMFRANGIQIKCPACHEMPAPKAEIQR